MTLSALKERLGLYGKLMRLDKPTLDAFETPFCFVSALIHKKL